MRMGDVVRIPSVAPGALSADPEADLMAARAAQLGADVLEECRMELMMAFRFLDAALWHVPFAANPALPSIGADGSSIQFAPLPLLARYASLPHEVVRDYLHLMLHCVFRHPCDADHPDDAAWSLACDIVVEGIAIEMGGSRWACARDGERRRVVDAMTERAGSLNPYKIYRLLHEALSAPAQGEKMGMPWGDIEDWMALFYRDAHVLWATRREDDRGEETRDDDDAESRDDEGEGPSDGGDDESAEGDAAEGDPGDAEASDEAEPSDDGGDDEGEAEEDSADRSDEERAWEEIAKQVEVALESHLAKQGEGAGALSLNLALATQPPIDYAEFLRRFATITEEMKINDDEFDYVYYTYGLTLYGNMPLVEPLEYQETNRVREFVIAIDTSGSTQGELVRTFVTRTCEILRETEEFASDVNIHIIQCDANIQEDAKITSLDDLESYRDSFLVRGGGGTDFRPVFERVDAMIDEGEFDNLRGLIYFTDGEGTYPTRMPSYDTAFVFVDDDRGARRVPPWAMKVVMGSDDIRGL